jgi:hypothetical protein
MKGCSQPTLERTRILALRPEWAACPGCFETARKKRGSFKCLSPGNGRHAWDQAASSSGPPRRLERILKVLNASGNPATGETPGRIIRLETVLLLPAREINKPRKVILLNT